MSSWFEIRVPRTLKWQPQVAGTFAHAVVEHIASWMSFQLICTHDQSRWIILSPDENNLSLDAARSLARSYYPEAEVLDPDGWGLDYPHHRRTVVFARNETDFFETFVDVQALRSHDPLATMVQTLDQLQPGELLTYHVDVTGTITMTDEDLLDLLTISAHEAGYRYHTTAPYRLDWAEYMGASLGNMIRNRKLKKERVPRYEDRDMERYVAKLRQKLLRVAVYLRFDSPVPERLQSLSDTVAAIKGLTNGSLAQLVDGVDRQGVVTSDEDSNALWPGSILAEWDMAEDPKQQSRICPRDLISLLTADEFAALWHLPHEGFTASGIQWVDQSVKPMPETLKSIDGGIDLGRNGDDTVRLPADERTHHAAIVGKVGTGKSSLQENMARQDMAAGLGVCFLDPHRSSYSNLVRYGIPAGREGDVVLLDCGDLEHPPALNPLYRPSSIAVDVAADMMMSVMSKVYDDFAFREMADTLHMALMTLLAADAPTLLDIPRVFADAAFRRALVTRLDDFIVTQFWDRFEGMSDAKQAELTRPVLRRLNPFYSNKYLRAITCHPRPLNLHALMVSNKIILVTLGADEAKVPSDHLQLLGAMLVAQVQMAAMGGAVQRAPFMFYIDEAQNFVTSALPKMLAEARKYGLGLVLANQYLRQLAGETLDAVEGTVSTLIAFEVGEPDAKALAPYMKPQFQVEDLIALGKYRAAITMRHQNARHPAFTLETLPPLEPADERLQALGQERERQVRQRSIENYTPMTYSEVDAWLRERYQPSPAQAEDDDNFIEPTRASQPA